MNKPEKALDTYRSNLQKHYATGIATEHTYRPALKLLIEELKPGVLATNEPKRIKCGAPDYIVSEGDLPLGYIEAKDIGESLDKVEQGEQMGRYLPSLANLVLTDYVEFRWYVSGVHRLSARLGKLSSNGKLTRVTGGAAEVAQLLDAFLAERAPVVADPRELAERMAAIARLIRDTITRALAVENPDGTLREQMEGFREVLLHELEPATFADMYAQTIAYGLFAARANAPGGQVFTREHAAYDLPKTNPFLRRMFGHIAGPELDERIAWTVDDLAELLHRANMAAILANFGNRSRQEDPVVHFYETFLTSYDSEMREARGVYYTPEPVVSYIVRSVDMLLKRDFQLSKGLADKSKVKIKNPVPNAKVGKKRTKALVDVHKVIVLDPATGTGTFLHGVIDHVYAEVGAGSAGMWSSYVSQHLLPRLFGFELLMAPYAVAHMKLGLQLAETGYDFKADERLRVYLTNTLEEAHEMTHMPLFTQWLADEANAANRVKRGTPIMVVLGNPPYSGHSANKGEWITSLLKGTDSATDEITGSYFHISGAPLQEVQVKWLHDDYVKFVRFAQRKIEQTGYGILAFITNNGYLENPTFRAMRHSLLETFDDIYLLDLHGNTKRKEVAEDGSADVNVFDIQQGVAIGLFVKRGAGKAKAQVFHADLRGSREIFTEKKTGERQLTGGKYHWLATHDVESTEWSKVTPEAPSYLFVSSGGDGAKAYERGRLLPEIMAERTVGIVSARDALTMHFTPAEALLTVKKFASLGTEEAREYFDLKKDARDWKVALAQHDVRRHPISKDYVVPVLYRPFDVRYTYYTGQSRGFIGQPQYRIMRNMIGGGNVGIATPRAIETARGWEHALVSEYAIQHHTVSIKEVNYLFPLFLLADGDERGHEQGALGDLLGEEGRRTNLDASFITQLAKATGLKYDESRDRGDLKKDFGPEDVLAYIYAVLNAPSYRQKFAAFLKRDFPRIPLIRSASVARRFTALGRDLIDLHLMRRDVKTGAKFPVKGSNIVKKVRFVEDDSPANSGRVWLNEVQYFTNVPRSVWAFHIGGYRICEKWLSDRKGRELGYDELSHYLLVLGACKETLDVIMDLDGTVAKAGGWGALIEP